MCEHTTAREQGNHPLWRRNVKKIKSLKMKTFLRRRRGTRPKTYNCIFAKGNCVHLLTNEQNSVTIPVLVQVVHSHLSLCFGKKLCQKFCVSWYWNTFFTWCVVCVCSVRSLLHSSPRRHRRRITIDAKRLCRFDYNEIICWNCYSNEY